MIDSGLTLHYITALAQPAPARARWRSAPASTVPSGGWWTSTCATAASRCPTTSSWATASTTGSRSATSPTWPTCNVGRRPAGAVLTAGCRAAARHAAVARRGRPAQPDLRAWPRPCYLPALTRPAVPAPPRAWSSATAPAAGEARHDEFCRERLRAGLRGPRPRLPRSRGQRGRGRRAAGARRPGRGRLPARRIRPSMPTDSATEARAWAGSTGSRRRREAGFAAAGPALPRRRAGDARRASTSARRPDRGRLGGTTPASRCGAEPPRPAGTCPRSRRTSAARTAWRWPPGCAARSCWSTPAATTWCPSSTPCDLAARLLEARHPGGPGRRDRTPSAQHDPEVHRRTLDWLRCALAAAARVDDQRYDALDVLEEDVEGLLQGLRVELRPQSRLRGSPSCGG